MKKVPPKTQQAHIQRTCKTWPSTLVPSSLPLYQKVCPEPGTKVKGSCRRSEVAYTQERKGSGQSKREQQAVDEEIPSVKEESFGTSVWRKNPVKPGMCSSNAPQVSESTKDGIPLGILESERTVSKNGFRHSSYTVLSAGVTSSRSENCSERLYCPTIIWNYLAIIQWVLRCISFLTFLIFFFFLVLGIASKLVTSQL